VLPTLTRPLRVLAALPALFVRTLTAGVVYAAGPFIILFLRQIVRSAAFWRKGLSQAVGSGSASRMDASWVDGYRRPSAVIGWDQGMLRVVLAAVTGGKNNVFAAAAAKEEEEEAGEEAAERKRKAELSVVEALAGSGVRVLIIHGEGDAIVPVSNSRRLASMLPGAWLVLMPGVGHMPHEERPEDFLEAVHSFMMAA